MTVRINSKIDFKRSHFKDISDVDTHRHIPRKDGGEYTIKNTDAINAVEHQKVHGNYKKRPQQLEELKELVDRYKNLVKAEVSISNRLDSAKKRKTSYLKDDSIEFFESQLKETTKFKNKKKGEIEKHIKGMQDDPLIYIPLKVRGVGPIVVSQLRVYVELDGIFGKNHPRAGREKAPHPSSLWALVGVDKAFWQRYQKGVKGGGNKILRTELYDFAGKQLMLDGPYKYLYYREYVPPKYRYSQEEINQLPKKEREAVIDARIKNPHLVGQYGRLDLSENQVWTKNNRKEWEVRAWKDTMLSHRSDAAKRVIVKHFLADYWMVGRTILGLPTNPVYPEYMYGGHHRTIMPEERGWVY